MTAQTATQRAAEELQHLRRFAGSPEEFWWAFSRAVGGSVEAQLAVVLVRAAGETRWERQSFWPDHADTERQYETHRSFFETAAAKCRSESAWPVRITDTDLTVVAVRLDASDDDAEYVAAVLCRERDAEWLDTTVAQLRSVADLPATYALHLRNPRGATPPDQLAEALDVLFVLNEHQRFLAVAMALCNELAARYAATRVSLGWSIGSYVRLQAGSHLQKFEKKMEVVRALEVAMEEAFDQDEEIAWPAKIESASIARNHAAFAKQQGVEHILSLPIRVDDSVRGVLTLERSSQAFSEVEVQGLRLICDLAARRLDDLKARDGWFFTRWRHHPPAAFTKLFGPEHTWLKLSAVLTAALLAVLIFVPIPYRVEATFALKTPSLAHLPAPFDGFLETVPVRVGDEVEAGKTLLTLDKRQLQIQESEARADERRFRSEADAAQAQGDLLQLRIALAQAEQAVAKAAILRGQVDQAEIRAPFAAVVVEGDLTERVGAPVKKGQVLMKVARIEGMYAELLVAENSIHEIREGAAGQVAFSSRPEFKFPFTVTRIEPVAQTKEKGNVFLVRATFSQPAETWWRPGMTGIAKVEVGQRSILWIVTHRAIDFLRMKFWF